MEQTSARLHLAEMRVRLNSCRLCLDAGYDIFPRAIYSGDAGAQIMILGQAPGITEKDAGRPFNAGSGKRLFSWLADAGIEEDWFRKTQYMTSITKCYPGRNGSGNGDRVPSRAEQRLCWQYLERELEWVAPQLIIPVGRLAIGVFFSSKLPLEEIIGTYLEQPGRVVIPLPHPSGASRWHQSAENRERVRQAVGLIRQEVLKIIPA
jgi:uracil-DNA glycosylase